MPLGSWWAACGLVRLGRAPAAGLVRPSGRPAGRLRHAGQHPRGAPPAVPSLPPAAAGRPRDGRVVAALAGH
eukprot:9474101-Alexandrium_andersonii.AAC.1